MDCFKFPRHSFGECICVEANTLPEQFGITPQFPCSLHRPFAFPTIRYPGSHLYSTIVLNSSEELVLSTYPFTGPVGGSHFNSEQDYIVLHRIAYIYTLYRDYVGLQAYLRRSLLKVREKYAQATPQHRRNIVSTTPALFVVVINKYHSSHHQYIADSSQQRREFI